MGSRLIDALELPIGLRNLTPEELTQVSQELREELIESISSSGGHFASSLGTTEISVVLHHLFETPNDRLVWDVGHQAYVHKMLTGRLSKLRTIRKSGGISGFLKREESPYDCFGAGHAGTSISAAVGLSVALQKKAEAEKQAAPYVVAVIGDGSMTSGMAFEALNHAGDLKLKRFIVVLNDNEMSISPNVGALSWLFSRAVTNRVSTAARSNIKQLYKRGYVPELVYKTLDRAEDAAQGFFASPALLFESFGFRYIGPVDGHDTNALIKALEHAKNQDVPVLVHARTVKGKGYEPAEEDPLTWHGVNPFNRSEGKFIASSTKKPPTYTNVFADALIELAEKDPRIVAITAAMLSGTGLDRFQTRFPQRCYDVGICEQHAVTFAAGLACEGMKPVCAIYSTFLQRGFDQLVHDVCIQNLPVVFCLDRGGLVGNDGETHQGVFDISFLRGIPNLTLMSPKDEQELRDMLYTALQTNGPVAIRYPRGHACGVPLRREFSAVEIGKAETIEECPRLRGDVAIIAYGPMVALAAQLSERLRENHGLSVSVINARFAKPLDIDLIGRQVARHSLTLTLEDHALIGGFGAAILEGLNEQGISAEHVLRCGVEDFFTPHASQEEQHQMHCLDVPTLEKLVLRSLPKPESRQSQVHAAIGSK